MDKITEDTIKETIKGLPRETQEIILHLTKVFEGEEETINEYIKNKINQ